MKLNSIKKLQMVMNRRLNLDNAPSLIFDIVRHCIFTGENPQKSSKQLQTCKKFVCQVKNQQPLGLILSKRDSNIEILKIEEQATDEVKSFLKTGDVITAVDGIEVTSLEHYQDALEVFSNLDTLNIHVERRSLVD
eukprot:CAMPEP_0117806432 /NCGR_PEP_ID=MMETSP0948-20121206/18572_1 /TAXON_ID=44440 /ORGANISM="Chattonella subsalsa, Strain CCMP2191" /LENGTH=135 /DNA_ID=CAMNT_0005640921 /DNA_START=125 /DNA_END=529 /DNA_ORIENTATION=-